MIRRVGAAACALLVAALASPVASAATAPAPLFRVTDPRLDELSGLAAGIASPGVLYAQNDSGDSARFFALDARSGAVLATYSVRGATNVDWEDLAVATDAQGVPSVWIADIGDNDAQRDEVRIYRVDEPRVDLAARDQQQQTASAQVWRLRYPGGPGNAESLAVLPGGAAYIFGKSIDGATPVFAVAPRPDPDHVQPARKIGELRLHLTGTAGGPNPVGQLTATGASISADGGILALRTYTDAYLWRLGPGGVAAAVRTRPVRLALPAQPQGEGIAVVGDRLLIDSEKVGSAVYSLPLPAIPLPPVPSSSASASEGASSALAGSAPITPSPSASRAPAKSPSRGVGGTVVGVAVLAAAFGASVLLRRRRQRRR